MATIGQRLLTHGNDANNNFTLIRILAAIAVVYGHCFALAKDCEGCVDTTLSLTKWRYSGDVALYVFFFVSGFLITASLHKNRSYFKFFGARFKRIFPGLFAFIVITTFVVGPAFTSLSLAEYFASKATWSFVFKNIILKEYVYALPGVFDNARYASVTTGTTWSLWVEVRLYVISCTVAVLGATRSRAIGNVLVLSLIGWGVFAPSSFPLIGINPDNLRIAAFYAAGSLVYINRDVLQIGTEGMIPLGIALIAARGYPGYDVIASAFLCYAVLAFALARKVKLPSFVQDYSYGIYLYGWVVQQIIAVQAPQWGPYKMMMLAVPVSVILGAASWFLVEKPAMRFHRRTKIQAVGSELVKSKPEDDSYGDACT